MIIMKIINLSLSDELHTKLKMESVKQGRSMNRILTNLVINLLEANTNDTAETEERKMAIDSQ